MIPFITGAVLAAFAGYALVWFLGPMSIGPLQLPAVDGNFALLLFLATLVSGAYWFAERLYFLPRRRAAAAEYARQAEQRRADLANAGISKVDGDDEEGQRRLLAQPWWLDWTAGLFPVIFAVFILRSFLFEPFKIPSGSMVPTLLVGDLILVNKFTYGVRLPVIHTKVTEGSPPQRGDVMVFRYPPKPSLDYIKRVVGVPGDEVAYLNKKLTVNGVPVSKTPLPDFFDPDAMRYSRQFAEDLAGHRHQLLNDDDRPAFVAGVEDFAFKQNCRYSADGVTCKVPPGHYFMMGDNRDNSLDSRYWGFVPEANIVGRAFLVWMNFSHPSRIGRFE